MLRSDAFDVAVDWGFSVLRLDGDGSGCCDTVGYDTVCSVLYVMLLDYEGVVPDYLPRRETECHF